MKVFIFLKDIYFSAMIFPINDLCVIYFRAEVAGIVFHSISTITLPIKILHHFLDKMDFIQITKHYLVYFICFESYCYRISY